MPFFLIGLIFGSVEYLIRLATPTPDSFWPLIMRSSVMATILGATIGVFDIITRKHFTKRPFLYLVFLKAISYTLILSFWLIIGNGLWELYSDPQLTFQEGALMYMNKPIFLINLITIFGVILIYSSLIQINSLHRKGELLSFVIGRYHQPVEVERIFAFIDLKGSTGIAENLGHKRFGLFLKDYYSDITEPIRNSHAEIYQYVGDEVILSWAPATGRKNNKAIRCITELQQTITGRSSYYQDQYGYVPKFRTGMHVGKVLITWVGELKKEILYIGDVMNTTARIQEECKRLEQDFLISEEIVNGTGDVKSLNIKFEEQTVPRGKEKPVRLYSVNSVALATPMDFVVNT